MVGVCVVISVQQGADCLHMAQLMPLHPNAHRVLPHLSSDWFYFSCTSLPSLSWKRGHYMGVVGMCGAAYS